jgi:hypothetical protein
MQFNTAGRLDKGGGVIFGKYTLCQKETSLKKKSAP